MTEAKTTAQEEWRRTIGHATTAVWQAKRSEL